MSEKRTFSERLEDVLGQPEDTTTITLVKSDGGVIVRVAIGTEEHGVLKQSREVSSVAKLTPHRLLSAAEDAYTTLTTCIAVYATRTSTFDES